MMSNELMSMSFLSRIRYTSWVKIFSPVLCQCSDRMGDDGITISLISSLERKFLNEHANLVWIGMKLACTQKQSFVLSMCICRRWRGLILHSRVDRSLVYFIHFTWRDACLSWLAASLRFTQPCTRQTMRQFCSWLASSGESALDCCYCIHFELKYH